MSEKELPKKGVPSGGEPSQTIALGTPQQDSDWPESKKLEWLKKSSAKLLKVLNQT
jgi:hypothetical protein